MVLATTNQHEWEKALASYSARFDRTVSVCGASEHQDQYVFGWVDRAKKGEAPSLRLVPPTQLNCSAWSSCSVLLLALPRAADDSWDLFDEGGRPCQAVKPLDYRQLTDALEECDGEPDLDDGKDRDGWLVVLDRLRALLTPETAKPAPARRAL